MRKDGIFFIRWADCGTTFGNVPCYKQDYREVNGMPRKPKHPCRYPGCPRLTEERYCEEHKRLANQQYDRYSRDKVARKIYGSREWKKIRARFLAAHPLCEQCRKEGRLTAATEVHHILPLRRGGTHADENLMALCKPCHSRIGIQMGDRFHNR